MAQEDPTTLGLVETTTLEQTTLDSIDETTLDSNGETTTSALDAGRSLVFFHAILALTSHFN